MLQSLKDDTIRFIGKSRAIFAYIESSQGPWQREPPTTTTLYERERDSYIITESA